MKKIRCNRPKPTLRGVSHVSRRTRDIIKVGMAVSGLGIPWGNVITCRCPTFDERALTALEWMTP